MGTKVVELCRLDGGLDMVACNVRCAVGFIARVQQRGTAWS